MHGRLSDKFILLSFQGMQYEMHTKSTSHHVIHAIGCYNLCTWLSGCLKCAPYHMMRCTMLSVCFRARINWCSPEKLVHELGEPLHGKIRWHELIPQGLAEFSQVSQSTWQMDNPVHTTQRNWQRCVARLPWNPKYCLYWETRWQAISNLAWSYWLTMILFIAGQPKEYCISEWGNKAATTLDV